MDLQIQDAEHRTGTESQTGSIRSQEVPKDTHKEDKLGIIARIQFYKGNQARLKQDDLKNFMSI